MPCRSLILLAGLVVSLGVGRPAAAQVAWEREAYDAAAQAPKSDPAAFDRFERHVYAAGDARMPYRLRKPDAAGQGRRHPLLVLLHGSGGIGDDNEKQLGALARSWLAPELLARYPAYLVAPQMPERSANYRADRDGLPAAEAGPPLPTLLALIDDLAARLPVDRERIYLVGFSMGASTALLATSQRPRQFAAVAAFAPVPPPRAHAADAVATPLLLVHGSADEENPYAADRAWAEALARAGGRPRFLSVEGMGHELPAQLARRTDWRDWLFAQRRGSTDEPAAAHGAGAR